jgi:putative lipoic acid-binding regulatory protein
MSKESEFYEKLRISLTETTTFPTRYLYKFIISSSVEKVAEIETFFDNMGAVIDKKVSANAKYTSLSIHVTMNSAEEIIEKYIEVSKVEGVISL